MSAGRPYNAIYFCRRRAFSLVPATEISRVFATLPRRHLRHSLDSLGDIRQPSHAILAMTLDFLLYALRRHD